MTKVSITDELAQDVLPLSDKDRSEIQQRLAKTDAQIDNILQSRYANPTRNQADSMVGEIDAAINSLGAFIDENDTAVFQRMRQAAMIFKEPESRQYPTHGNPWHELALSHGNVIYPLLLNSEYKDRVFRSQDVLIRKLLKMIQDTKDTEVEALKLDQERLITADIRKDYQEVHKELRAELADKHRTIIELTDQVRQMARQVHLLSDRVLTITGERPDHADAMLDRAPPAAFTGGTPAMPDQLLPEETAALKKYTSMGARIRYLADRHPEWADDVIAGHVGATADQVRGARAAKK